MPHQMGAKKIHPRISTGFSNQNLTKTALRNRLGEESLDILMTISIEGPPLSKFDFHEACQVWHTKKNSREGEPQSES